MACQLTSISYFSVSVRLLSKLLIGFRIHFSKECVFVQRKIRFCTNTHSLEKCIRKPINSLLSKRTDTEK